MNAYPESPHVYDPTWPQDMEDSGRENPNSIKIIFFYKVKARFFKCTTWIFVSSTHSEYIWKYIKWRNKDNSVDKFMKIKFLNQENFNYIRKYPNRENFSRWKITASHNLEKQLKTDKLRILCL